MSIASVITGGLGNGTFSGSPALLITDGYSIGEAVVVTASPTQFGLMIGSEDFGLAIQGEDLGIQIGTDDAGLKV